MGPNFIGPFQIVARVGKEAYCLDLLDELSQIYSIFHDSQLQKCVIDETVVVPLDDIQVNDHLNYVERPLVIIDIKMKTLCNKELSLVKVQWQH